MPSPQPSPASGLPHSHIWRSLRPIPRPLTPPLPVNGERSAEAPYLLLSPLAGRGRVRGRAGRRAGAEMCECRSPQAGEGAEAAPLIPSPACGRRWREAPNERASFDCSKLWNALQAPPLHLGEERDGVRRGPTQCADSMQSPNAPEAPLPPRGGEERAGGATGAIGVGSKATVAEGRGARGFGFSWLIRTRRARKPPPSC
jgi:hypothetical protein